MVLSEAHERQRLPSAVATLFAIDERKKHVRTKLDIAVSVPGDCVAFQLKLLV